MANSLFWRIRSSSAAVADSYIFGTVHLPVADSRLSIGIHRCIDEVERVYTETDLSDQLTSSLRESMLLPLDHDRTKYISDHRWIRVVRAIDKSYDIKLESMQMLRPLIMMGQLYERAAQTDGVKLDQYIWQIAMAKGKSTHGLESVNEQIDTLRAIPLSYDYDILMQWSRNVGKSNRQLKNLMNIYQRQDIHALHRISTRSLGSIRHIMLRDRNVRMVDRIAQGASEMPSFFTFGAGHLGGYHGVIRLLKQKGISVIPMNNIQ